MSKLKFHTREIGSVAIFDLLGNPGLDEAGEVQDVAWRMQKNIRRHRLQRIIVNMKGVTAMDAIGMRKILAACIRPKQSIIYGAAHDLLALIAENHLPHNIGVCSSEKEVAEKFGPFLFDREETKKEMDLRLHDKKANTPGGEIDRRRSHRMHVALPLEIKICNADQRPIVTTAIATNISEGGLFAEYLDLDAAAKIEDIENLPGRKAHIHIYPSAFFPGEFDVMSIVRRREVRGKQLGIAVEFTA